MSTNPHGPRTSYAEVPVCNQRLYKEVGALMKLDPSTVEEMTAFVGSFIAQTIKKGQLEPVRIRYFGEFRAKKKTKHLTKILATRACGMEAFLKKATNPVDITKPTSHGR